LAFLRKRAPFDGRNTPVVSAFRDPLKLMSVLAPAKSAEAGVKVKRRLDGVAR
jgi:hypothetical protein